MVLLLFVATLNGVVSYLLMLAASHLMGRPVCFLRLIIPAMLSALYGGLCLLRTDWILGSLPCRLLFLLITALIAFGVKESGYLCGILYIAMQLVAGGGKREPISQLLSLLGIAVLCGFFLSGGQKTIPVFLSFQGRQVKLSALKDTGNTLKDPLTGRPVLIIGPKAAGHLTGLSLQELKNPIDTLSRQPIKGLRLIPYRTIDRRDGMLLGLTIWQGRVGSRKGGIVVAFSGEELDDKGVIEGLIGGRL